MENNKYEKHIFFLLCIFYSSLGISFLWLFPRYLFFWISPFLLGYLFACFLRPLVCFLVARFHFKEYFACVFAIFLSCSGFLGLFALFIHQMIFEFKNFSFIFPQYLSQLEKIAFTFSQNIAQILKGFGLSLPLYEDMQSLFPNFSQNISGFLPSLSLGAFSFARTLSAMLPQFFLFIIAFLVSSYFFSVDYVFLRHVFLSQFKPKQQTFLIQFRTHLFSTLFSYLKALLLLLSITFIELFIGFWLIGIDYIFLFALLITLVDALPLLGAGTILIPWALLSLFMGNYIFALSLFLLYGIILLVRQILEPKIIGKSIGIHPLLTLFSIYLGFQTLGLSGMFFGPFFLIILKFLQTYGYLPFFKLPPSPSS